MTAKRIFLLLSLFFALPSVRAATPPIEEIVRRADEARGPSGDVTFRVQVKDFNGTSLLRTNVYHVYSKNGKYVLVETEQPQRLRGRKLLMRDQDLWLYLPSIKQPTRISLQQKLTGEVSNGDLAKASFHEDYAPKLLGTTKEKGESYYEILLTAKHKDCTYRSAKLWINTKTYRPLRAQYFALSGKPLKNSFFSKPKSILGETRMTQVVIQDAIDPSRKSLLKYYDYRREKLDASLFSKESLP